MHSEKRHLEIVSHYESCLEKHGDTHRGVDWPNQRDAETRYRVMLEVIRGANQTRSVSLLDFGCGASHLYEFMRAQQIKNVEYAGLDLSPKFIELSRQKFPENRYFCIDVLEESAKLPMFDYIVMNGVFTEKCGLSFDEMLEYFQKLVRVVFGRAEIGLAFNAMSKHVDWEREDLFHLPFDVAAKFFTAHLSRNFLFRNDYGLYEYTVYIYH